MSKPIIETYYCVSQGGQYKKPHYEVITISSEDEEMEEFDNFKEYRNYVLEEAQAEVEQHFGIFSALTEEQVRELVKLLP